MATFDYLYPSEGVQMWSPLLDSTKIQFQNIAVHSPTQANVLVSIQPDLSTSTRSIYTKHTGVLGVTLVGFKLTQGPFPLSQSLIDNWECLSGPTATVSLRRVIVSTMPEVVDHEAIGQTYVALNPGDSIWVEFPPTLWTDPNQKLPNPSRHYCLQVNADASPDDPSPGWSGLSLQDRHYSQRNIVFI